jgi:hypothetical protein
LAYEITLDETWQFEDFEILPSFVVLKNCRNHLGEQIHRKLVPVTGVLDIRQTTR